MVKKFLRVLIFVILDQSFMKMVESRKM